MLSLDTNNPKEILIEDILNFESSIKNKYLRNIPLNNIKFSNDQHPFYCGLLGYCSYELGEQLQIKKPEKTLKNRELSDFPRFFLGFYTWSYVYDHKSNEGLLSFSPYCSKNLQDKILSIIENAAQDNFCVDTSLKTLTWQRNQSYADYAKQFNKVKNYILDGDCYQINLAQMFSARSSESSVDLYFSSRETIQTPFSCLLKFNKEQQLLSFSPEQFIKIENGIIESRPIKGTAVNDGDKQKILDLQKSAKNQAENIMIVDLLRNDLGKVCQEHSVHVPALLEIESFQNVHHLVSTIKGKLKPDISEIAAFLSCFPGGSITGAPKVRAMEIIHELEATERSAYCGSVFYLNQQLNFNSNILIRSVVKNKDQLFCWGGGGIVADSELEDEYLESLFKVSNITGFSD